jgi:hypothetical protein
VSAAHRSVRFAVVEFDDAVTVHGFECVSAELVKSVQPEAVVRDVLIA